MFREERLWEITQTLFEKQKVVSRELAREYGLNVATIRLDLAELERRGVAKRVYGGAVLADAGINGGVAIAESPFVERLNLNRAEKEAIGKATAALIQDGETVMIDGGSTTYQVCARLGGRRNLTVISCAIHDQWENLVSQSDLQLFLTGGLLRPESLSLVGGFATDMLHRFRARRAILGIDGISLENGFTALNFLEADIKRQMIASSEELIFIADHTKFGRVGPIPVAALDQVRKVVTDAGAPPEIVEGLRAAGIEVILARGGAEEGASRAVSGTR